MTMRFNCELNTIDRNETWQGRIRGLIDYGSHSEIFIESRSSISLLFGKTSRGGFACVPDFNKGCHLVSLKDEFWNTEKLVSILGTVDGITASTALYHLSKRYNYF